MNQQTKIEHILVIENKKGKYTILLESATYSVGRDPTNSIVIDSPWISRHHASLLRVTNPGNSNHSFRLIDGDLQGKRSTNGLKINGQACFSHDLRHKDEILFGRNVKARYYAINSPKLMEFMNSGKKEEFTGFLSNTTNPYVTLVRAEDEGEKFTERALERLASFPELISNPIIEIDVNGNITYLNPAAVQKFPGIQEEKLQHPVLAQIVSIAENSQTAYFVREVKVAQKVFAQHVNYIAASDLIRSYLVDITEKKQAEETLQKITTLQRAILNSANYTIISTSLDGTILTFNAAAERYLQYSAAEIIEKTTPLLIHDQKEIRQRAKELSQELDAIIQPGFDVLVAQAQCGKLEEKEWTYVRKDGSSFPVLLSVTALRDGENHITGFLMIGNDITERKQVEALLKQTYDELELRVEERTTELKQINKQLQSEVQKRKRIEEALRGSIATNRALLNAIPDWMFRIDSNGILVNFKASKNQNVPLLSNEFLGKELFEMLPKGIAPQMMECVSEALSTGEMQIFEYQLPQKDYLLDYEARIAVSAENEVMAIIRDITEQKRSEQDIRNALIKEKQLNELKSRFISMTSHEFRTPLATILSSAELLEHYSHKWNEDKKHHHLHRIQTSVEHMTRLLNDVLLLGKAEAGQLKFNPAQLNLSEFCQEMVEEMQLNASDRRIFFRIHGQSLITTHMDEKLLRHILTNLLSNAIKYSPENEPIYFDLIYQQQTAIFRIKDQGIGIPKEEQHQLFNSFHRASNVGSISGTGLGLAIVKKAVDLHSGEIQLESEIGIGTTFTVILPLNKKVETYEKDSCD
jgi:PAS domain S-box-containing protein